MDPTHGEQKRKHKRVLIMQELEINGKPLGQAIDLSLDGMYICSRAPFSKGDIPTLRFILEGMPLEMKVQVLYTHEGIGMGVRFINLRPEDRDRIRQFVKSAASLHKVQRRDHRKQILIIDDNEFYQRVYQHRLLAEGYSVLTARNGLEGLKILMQERPDLILLDLVMEGMDGYKVLHIIKTDARLSDIPVIVCSVKGATQEVDRAISQGAADYLLKSTTTPHKAIEKIKQVLHRYAQQST